jgi:multidrug efflux pump subunit AcrB
VRKQSGTNTLAVVEGVKERLAEIKPLLPAGLRVASARPICIYPQLV